MFWRILERLFEGLRGTVSDVATRAACLAKQQRRPSALRFMRLSQKEPEAAAVREDALSGSAAAHNAGWAAAEPEGARSKAASQPANNLLLHQLAEAFGQSAHSPKLAASP